MGIPERKARHKAELRNDILCAARELAHEKGWEHVSTRKVAEKVEYSTTVIYEYFGNKEALLHALQVEGFVKLRKQLESIQHQYPQNPQERLVAISMAKWQFAIQSPEIYQVMFGLGGVCCRGMQCDQMNALGHVVNDTLSEIVGGEIEQGMKMNWLATLHGFIALHLNPQFNTQPKQLEQFLEASVRRFIQSLETQAQVNS